jgi:hypothetical protein
MAILFSDNVSDWYYFEDFDTQVRFLFENFSSNKTREVTPKKLLQGFPGTLAMDIGGASWQTVFSSNALILNNDPLYKDIFDLLLADFDTIKQFLAYSNTTLTDKNLLSSASIEIGQDVSISLDYNQKFDRIFNFNYLADEATEDFTGRVAKFYDCNFYLSLDRDAISYLNFPVYGGSINIKIDYDKLYFVNSETDFPFYNPQQYSISGSVSTIVDYNKFSDFISNPSEFNLLMPTSANCSLSIGDRYLELGQVNIQSGLSIQKQSGLLEVKIDFTTYARHFEEQT